MRKPLHFAAAVSLVRGYLMVSPVTASADMIGSAGALPLYDGWMPNEGVSSRSIGRRRILNYLVSGPTVEAPATCHPPVG